MKRTWETMEEAPADIEMAVGEVLPTIEEAGEAVAEAVPFLEEAGIIAGEVAVTAAEGVEALTNPIAAGALLASTFMTIYDKNGKRKRTPVITGRAPDATRPDPTRRGPYLPAPRRAGPERRNFGPPDIPGSSMPAKKSTGGKKRKAGKDLKRKSKTKRNVKRKTSSKKKPKKKSSSYTTTIKQEVHGAFKREHVSYFGFQATAGREELFQVCADALVRAILKKHNIGIRRTDETVPTESAVPQMRTFTISYRRTDYGDGSDAAGGAGAPRDVSAQSYEALVALVATEIKTKVEEGYYPHRWESKSSTGNIVMFNRKVGDAKLHLSVKRTIKLRNITKNDDGDHDTNALDTNPLQGRLYKFRHDVPRVNATLYESNRDQFAEFHDRVCKAGVIFGPQRSNLTTNHDGSPNSVPELFGLNKVLSSPPPGGRIWDNLSSSKKIGLMPGQSAKHVMAFKFSGTLRQFLAKFAASQYTAPSIGYCHMFGLEQKFKTGLADKVNVEYDCDDVLKGGCSFVREDISPPTVRSIHAHSSVVT